jgi:hypothetical protein
MIHFMDEAPSLNTVTLELYDDWPWTLHCPACGKAMMLHLVLRVSGMACGPVTTVHRFGFELGPPEPAEA